MNRLLSGIAAAATALTAALPVARGGSPAVQVGKPFPPLVLPLAADGRPWSVETCRGDKLMLHLFASW